MTFKDNTFRASNENFDKFAFMLRLQTPVADEKCKVGISYKDKIMMLGSCFSDSIGRQLQDLGFGVCVNPFGTLYNPASILRSIERLVHGTEFTMDDCVKIGAGDQRWCSFSHHTSFARCTREEFVDNANEELKKAREHFLACNKVIITLGTSWCFRHLEYDAVVSNCLKRPAAEFRRERLSVEEVHTALRKIMEMCPEKEFIFTVSPIRHFKDGAHGNQISKAGLLLGIEGILDSDKADYFPAYEIVMDELRDYRFYAEDMCHPTQQTVDYIRDRFLTWALPTEETSVLEDKIRTYKRMSHLDNYRK